MISSEITPWRSPQKLAIGHRLWSQNVSRLFPAGPPLQEVENSARKTPEVSLEGLVPIVDFVEEWQRLPNISIWVLNIIKYG